MRAANSARRRRVAGNRVAFAGGVAGTLAVSVTAALLLGFSPDSRARVTAPPRPAIAFQPGEIIRLGPKPIDALVPDKIVVDTRRAAATSPPESVTRTDDAPPSRARPSRARGTMAAGEDDGEDREDVEGNNAFDEPPTRARLPGDPRGEAAGWSERLVQGDPWATEVMKRLNGLRVGVYAGGAVQATLRFRLSVCSSGQVGVVKLVDRSGDPRLDRALVNELRRLELPPPPAEMMTRARGRCVKIDYVFSWGAAGVR